MEIKSAKYFREKYMTDIRHIMPNSGYNPDFVGCTHCTPDSRYIKGFFDMYHGDKEDVASFLSGNLKIAEDGQAIYEFMQNAADCGSTAFYMFYNDDYFLAINNGKPFTQKGLRSILNVGQSDKNSPSLIGRFGIGFKLVHRLVGKSDGQYELLHENKGPILFSWSRKSDLLSLLNKESVIPTDEIGDDSPLPYFLKMILTNFPSNVGETVKDLEYKDSVVFTYSEYYEFAEQAKIWLDKYVGDDIFNQGSIFFIKLGEGKRELLDKDYKQNLKTGVEYSLNTLKRLKNVKINDVKIDEVTLELMCGSISKDSDDFKRIAPEYANQDIHYSIGYNAIDFSAENPFVAVDALKKSPTFYKFFPLGDEMHQSAIFIHCDSLSNEANRRKLHDDRTNRELMPVIARFIIERLECMKNQFFVDEFKQLYANLLMSETPHDNSDWLKGTFYDLISSYIKTCVPTSNASFLESDKVFIRDVKCNVPLSLVNSEYQWFAWNRDANMKPLISAAKDKLGLKVYNVVDLVLDANVDILNEWIRNADEKTYIDFIEELSSRLSNINNTKIADKLRQLKLFRFSDGSYYSYLDIVKINPGLNLYRYDNTIPHIFTISKTVDISDVLVGLGFGISDLNLDDYPNIRQNFALPNDSHIFDLILEMTKTKSIALNHKKKLILHLTTTDPVKKFSGVGDESIRKLCMCKTENGNHTALSDMLGRAYKTPQWLAQYRIHNEDYFPELDKFLIPEKNVYAKVILPHWGDLTFSSDICTAYQDIRRYYMLDESNRSMEGMAFVYTEDGEFVTADKVIFNECMLNDAIDYSSIKNVMSTLFGLALPLKKTAMLLLEKPFELPNSRFTDMPAEELAVTCEDVKNFIKLCQLNNESFFRSYVVEKNDEDYYVIQRTEQHYQVYNKTALVKSFIENHCNNTMVLLPSEFSEFSDEPEIVKGDLLYNAILESVDDVDALKEELVDVLKYDSRRDFILRLSKVCLDLDQEIRKDDYSYKLMEMVCSSLNVSDYVHFRDILVIVKNGVSYNHNQIPSSVSDNVSVSGAKKTFDLASLLPNENGNGALLNELVEKMSSLGINRQTLNALLGISSEADLDEIYDTIVSNYTVLENAQQLAFMLLMAENYNKPLVDYKLKAADGSEVGGDFVVGDFEFIARNYTMSSQYVNLAQYMNLPYGNNTIIQEPYIDDDNTFVALGIETNGENGKLDPHKVTALLDFLMKLKKKEREVFKGVDWSDSRGSLGFNPVRSVYSREYATTSEALPEYVEEWAGKDSENVGLLADMGVETELGIPVKFRKFMIGQQDDFDVHLIYTITNVCHLENSLEWIGENCTFPLDETRYKALMIAVEQINKLRNGAGIVVSDEVDFEELENESIQCSENGYKEWSEELGYRIYLYTGKLPHKITLDEYIDDVVYCFNDGDIASNTEGVIFVNSDADLQDSMHQLAADNKIGLTTEEVYKLFNKSIAELLKEIESLKDENALLRTNPAEGRNVDMHAATPKDVDPDERPEYNEVARKKVMKRLMAEGYSFTNGCGDFSIIPGVFDPDGSPTPLVVKSCRWGKLYISPMEWGTLLMPGSMLWVFDGSNTMPIPLRTLIRNQEKLVLTMDTRNLDDVDKVTKFAQILQYFRQVNFEFESVRPSTIASTFKQYAFNDRVMDEKPEADDFE